MTTRRTITRKDRVRNRVVVLFHRIGLPFGPMQLLTVPGRRTGIPRTTPVAPVTIHGATYICQAYPRADWVQNARAAGRGTLTRGRETREVDLVEVPVAERGVVLREFPAQNPRGVGAFLRNGLVHEPTADAFAAAAPAVPMFRAVARERARG
ncbi:nitroreductase family deazaflavin-dependent oxidoreductase [Streptomyces sp. NRRL F-5123]|uniref:nitroreductase family deazaflavin-dependent oxidoreductase n=1 Tax=Streptomyces sp. NRRL F-5123 TaxID=1463856 RepID=UPI0004E0C4AA|nr:nitroreductase family deazaflavin-dependent oxidoreductase [Streptomyces sp. NRRL F-5123]